MKHILIRFIVLASGAVAMFLGGLLLAFRPTGGFAIPQGVASYAPLVATSPVSNAVFILGLVLLVLGFAAVAGWIGFEVGGSLRAGTAGSAPVRRKS
ncbi:MAG: hypothetical protein ABUT11_03725 [Leifsonia sp.]